MKCDPNCIDDDCWTPLHYASQNCHLDAVKYLVDTHHCDPQVKKNDNATPLHIAASHGHLELVKSFVEDMKCDPICINNDGSTPLHYASQNGHLDVVKYLVDTHHCDPQVKKNDNATPLHLAAFNGHLELVKSFVEDMKCDPICINNNGWTPLHYASQNGHLDVMKYLVDTHHCDPQVKNNDNTTPLHIAALNGHLELVKSFVEDMKCDPICINKNGWTPLHYASQNGHLDVVKYLVDTHHCDPQVKKNNNATLLHIAAFNGHLELVKSFVEDMKCDPICTNNNGSTPLHYASQNGHLDVVKYLVDTHHCDPQVKKNDNATPLHIAALHGHLELVKSFVEDMKCDPNCIDDNGSTPLYYASQNGHLDVVKYLVDTHHCDPQVKNNDNTTPLHIAALNGHLGLVTYFVEDVKCNPNCINKYGKTPFYYASQKGHLNLVQFFISSCIFHNPMVGQTAYNVSVANCHYHVASHILLHYSNHPIAMFKKGTISPLISLYVLGDSGSGKSTLVKSLSVDSSILGSIFQVEDVEPQTAGIVLNTIESQVFGKVNIYDFAGHKHYYASHEMILKQTPYPLIVIVVNISLPTEEIEKQVVYWATLVSNCRTPDGTIHVVIIGSHSDQVVLYSDRREIERQIKIWIRAFTLYFEYHGFIHCDCRYSTSDNLSRLRQKLNVICKSLGLKDVLDKIKTTDELCTKLLHFLQHQQSVRSIRTIGDLHEQMNSQNNILTLLTDQNLLIEVCKALNFSGHLLFFPHEQAELGIIVLNHKFMLSKVHACLSKVKTSLERSHNETGILAENQLKNILSKVRMKAEVAIEYLIITQFCTKITRNQLLSDWSKLEVEDSDREVHYFFPNLVLTSRPASTDLWPSGEENYSQLYTWCVRCADSHQFFTPRFTHTLFIQLVQYGVERKFAKFIIWKNGILLAHNNGTRSIIEVTEHTDQVNLVMRCFKGRELELVKQRAYLISLIKSLIKKVCSNIEVAEFLPHPQDDYPLQHTSEIPLSDIAVPVMGGLDYVVLKDKTRLQVPLSSLLFFDSFCKPGKSVIMDIFSKKSSVQYVSAETQAEVCSALEEHKLWDKFCRQFRNSRLTYTQLYTELHKYTIFPEGNLPVSVHVFVLWLFIFIACSKFPRLWQGLKF